MDVGWMDGWMDAWIPGREEKQILLYFSEKGNNMDGANLRTGC
jgi:hypothetical protein